jgi:hypothetical protein
MPISRAVARCRLSNGASQIVAVIKTATVTISASAFVSGE